MYELALANMARLVLCILALCAGAFAHSNVVEKVDLAGLAERQALLLDLYQHMYEPATSTIIQSDAVKLGKIEDNLDKYSNVTAARTYAVMLKEKWHLPREVPFSVNEPAHAFEAMTLFNVFYSAKDYDTFYNTAAYLRDITNEGLYVYALSIAIIYRHDTQGIALPAIYETFPAFFHNGEIIATAERINVHGEQFVKYYPSTYSSADGIVIKANATYWPFINNKNFALSYFTNDVDLNAAQYFLSLVTPYWLGGSLEPSVIYKERRGEAWWFAHRQLVARYYMERLSNDYDEIPEITNVYEDGFTSGLVYSNGVPFPSRPDNFRLDQPQLYSAFEKVLEFENRISDAIDKGFFVNRKGEHVSLLTDEGLNTLGLLIESNADSPNRYYYKDFIRIWKQILGNNIKPNYEYESSFTPLVVPSALESYKTALRDPAFYSLWKRILNLFVKWQKQMPLYKPEELIVPTVEIEKVEVDKLETFFETSFVNITSSLYQNKEEVKNLYEDTIVLVERERLNYKPFTVKVDVKSEVAKKVLVKFFLAPKYDSNGLEIPLHHNTENFFLLEQFSYDLPVGESVITRKSTEFIYTSKHNPTTWSIAEQVQSGEWKPYSRTMSVFPDNLLLPKGKVGGQIFQFVVYIQDVTPFRVPAFPSDRPLYSFQIYQVKNLKFQDVKIYHDEE